MGRWLAFDLGLIVCATFSILRVEVANRVAQGMPEYLIRTLQSPASSDYERMNAIWELSMFETDGSTQALQRAAREQKPPINLMAAATLLERNDISGLPLLEDVSLRHPSELRELHLQTYLGSIKDPAAIPSLIHLMASPDVEIRRGAAQALCNISLAATIDPLIEGLDDSDVEVQYYSVIGLAKISGKPYNGWYPGRGIFGQNTQYYLNHWKAWAKESAQSKP